MNVLKLAASVLISSSLIACGGGATPGADSAGNNQNLLPTNTTTEPSPEPTAAPIEAPNPTAEPTAEPTLEPTVVPTTTPTVIPTAVPTQTPTAVPTAEPTATPTAEPTAEPTIEPTQEPTVEPTPTPQPTAEPTPTPQPTVEPTPTPEPTLAPTPEITTAAIVDWDIPTTRENGDELLLSEIGGYEIMYRNTDDPAYTTIIITDQTVDEYLIDSLTPGAYEVVIAAFDTNGLYSDFSEPTFANIGI